ncbi:unannotated protein [freshwater metagenome]|jgi:flavorubredoxin|uniref:Unannotated protein n=1 Tax=freshwater metagenome TaxID=449393 RepID=A0A6J6BS23_9ZZZZ
MTTTIDEIADGIYRISTFVPDVGPTGFTFNQFLIAADGPLLFHTGQLMLFDAVSSAVATVVPLDTLRWITSGHVEADECGAMNHFLEVIDLDPLVEASLAVEARPGLEFEQAAGEDLREGGAFSAEEV